MDSVNVLGFASAKTGRVLFSRPFDSSASIVRRGLMMPDDGSRNFRNDAKTNLNQFNKPGKSENNRITVRLSTNRLQ